MKTKNFLWRICFIVIAMCSIILIGKHFLNIELPDFITRSIGLIDLAALLVFVYATVRGLKDKKGE